MIKTHIKVLSPLLTPFSANTDSFSKDLDSVMPEKKLDCISCFECALAKNDFGRTKYRIIKIDGWGQILLIVYQQHQLVHSMWCTCCLYVCKYIILVLGPFQLLQNFHFFMSLDSHKQNFTPMEYVFMSFLLHTKTSDRCLEYVHFVK